MLQLAQGLCHPSKVSRTFSCISINSFLNAADHTLSRFLTVTFSVILRVQEYEILVHNMLTPLLSFLFELSTWTNMSCFYIAHFYRFLCVLSPTLRVRAQFIVIISQMQSPWNKESCNLASISKLMGDSEAMLPDSWHRTSSSLHLPGW